MASLAILRWEGVKFWALIGFVKSIQRVPPIKAKKQAKANVPKLNGVVIRIIVATDRHIAVMVIPKRFPVCPILAGLLELR